MTSVTGLEKYIINNTSNNRDITSQCDSLSLISLEKTSADISLRVFISVFLSLQGGREGGKEGGREGRREGGREGERVEEREECCCGLRKLHTSCGCSPALYRGTPGRRRGLRWGHCEVEEPMGGLLVICTLFWKLERYRTRNIFDATSAL